MHLDGLADTVDGLGCYGGPEQSLAVDEGPGCRTVRGRGAGARAARRRGALLVSIAYGRAAVALVVAFATGRLAVTWACTPRSPAARPDGLGALVAGTTSARTAVLLTCAR